MSAPLLIRLLGGFDLSLEGGRALAFRGAKTRSLFAFLVLHETPGHTRDELAGLFWPDEPDAVARRRLSQALWRIRHAFRAAGLSPPLLINRDDARFDASMPHWLDVRAFEQTVSEGLDGLGGLTAMERANRLKEAIALYRGDLLAGYYDDWIAVEREQLREMYVTALARLVALYERLGAYEEALHYARLLASKEPLREAAHYELMRLLQRLHRPQEALQQYERLRAILDQELHAAPSSAAQSLARELAADAGRSAAVQRARTVVHAAAPMLIDPASLPLVGRSAERAHLLRLMDSALQGGGAIALVEGEAGVGKTRLLQEIARDAVWREMRPLWGRGRELTARASYDALLEAVREGLTPLRAQQLADLLPRADLEILTLILPELRVWLPELSGRIVRPGSERLSEALSGLILALGDIAGHVILLEDAHWADAATLDALTRLAETLEQRRLKGRPTRLLLIVSYRGEDAREQKEAWRSLRRLAQTPRAHLLRLSRLSAEETADLVRGALGLKTPAPRFESRIHDESEGNPLFVLETLRALMDEDLLARDAAGQWHTPFDATTRDYGELPLPPGVFQVIERRLNRLDPRLSEVLNAAAVLGREFDYLALARMLMRAPSSILDALTELVRRAFLLEEAATYAFAHDKIRRVAYETMSEETRRRWHARAAHVLADEGPVEALAYHAFYGRLWAQALTAGREAGDRARKVYAWSDAIAFYSQALEAWRAATQAKKQDRLALLQGRGEAYQNMGRWAEAERDLNAALDLARSLHDDEAFAAIGNRLSYLYFQQGDYARALAMADEVYEAARRARSKSQMAHAMLNAANALRNQGRPREALDYYRRAAELFDALNETALLADCLNRMGFALLFADQWNEAERVMQRSLSLRRQLDDKIGLAYSLCNLGSFYLARGDFERAGQVSYEAYDAAIAARDPYGQDAALLNRGNAYLGLGDLERAASYLRRALDIGREIGDEPLLMEGLADLGRVYLRKGDMVNARRCLEEALDHAEAGVEIWYRPKVHATMAEYYLALGDVEMALDHAQRAMDVAGQLNAACVTAVAHEVMARALTAGEGENEDAAARHFEQSIELAREPAADAVLARNLWAYARYLRSRGASDRARGMEDEARRLFQTLGMTWELAEIQAEDGNAREDRILVSLPAAEAPTGRPLRHDEWRSVLWTVAAVEDETIRGKTERRRHRLLRLLREAEEQGAAPRVEDLARALRVSDRTIKRDLAALRKAGRPAITRGRRG